MSGMLSLPDLAVALAYELESHKRNAQVAAENQKRTIVELRASRHALTCKLAAEKRENAALRGQVGNIQGRATCQRCDGLKQQLDQAKSALVRRKLDIEELERVTARARILQDERDSWADIAHNAQVEREHYKRKFELLLGELEDLREMAGEPRA